MALPIKKLPTYRPYIKPVPVIIKKCGNPNCNHIISTHDGFDYIHSKATDEFYCDMYCMAEAEEETIDFLDAAQREQFMSEMEGEYLP